MDDKRAVYRRSPELDAKMFIDLLARSGLAARRPVDDLERIERMLRGANLIVTAWDAAAVRLVGVARAVTDFAYCCYLSELAVDREWQGRGVGRRLIEEVRAHAGDESMCLLLATPDASGFYDRIGMPREERAFMFPRRR
jgi:GNAT superfamily N-acetyltransferase